MAFLQGAPLPDIKTTETKVDTAPSYYTDYLTGLSGAAKTAMGKTPAQSVAGYDELQTSGYGMLPDAATDYVTNLESAQTTAAQAAKGITPERIQALMNPYTSNVVDEMGRLSQQSLQRNILPTMKAGFVGTGGLGGQRYANALGQSMSDIQSNLTGQQYGALSKGYSEAMKGALDEAQLQNMAAQTQGRLTQQELDMALTGAGALTKAGAERQAYEQSLLDQPLKTATAASNLMRGYTMPGNQTVTFTGPKAGAYQTSGLADILGTMGAVGSVAGGTGLKTITDLGGNLLKYFQGVGSGNKTVGGAYNIDNSEYVGQNEAGTSLYYDAPTGKYYDPSGTIVPIDFSAEG